MITLLSNELRYTFSSLSGILFTLVYLVLCGCLLWVIPGDYHIPSSGYASMSAFFVISPILLMFFVSALSMRTFSEEKRMDTLSLLFTRPVSIFSIVWAKWMSVFVVVVVALVPTITHVISIYLLGSSPGRVDISGIVGSYLGLIFIIGSFTSISVFASALSCNQAVAFLSGFLICFGIFFGFDLLSGLFSMGSTQVFIKNLGFLSHYQSIQRGLIDGRDLCYMVFVSILFIVLTIWVLRKTMTFLLWIYTSLVLLILILGSFLFTFRIDFTVDKRYTISAFTKSLLHNLDQPLDVEVYLDGPMNAGFTLLKKETMNILNDLAQLSHPPLKVKKINPYHSNDPDYINQLQQKGIFGISVNERDHIGKMSQQVVFPWAFIQYGDHSLSVPLLINDKTRSGQENLKASIEMLEYQLVKALKLLSREKEQKIVFIFGHHELDSNQVGYVWDMLSETYQVDAGVMNQVVGQLDNYELVIIAGPRKPFSEAEKYILDQYLMRGGNILLFANGAIVEPELLKIKGATPSMANEINLNDMLFDYGLRINPVLVEDVICLEIPVTSTNKDQSDSFGLPWYFAPILSPSSDHPITKALSPVKSQFVSTISFTGHSNSLQKQVLLYTSEFTHIVQVPDMILLNEVDRVPDKSFFNQSHLPVAVLLEGQFTSSFSNRFPPSNADMNGRTFSSSSEPARLAVIASEDIIQNEIDLTGSEPRFYPPGYDRYSQTHFGNTDFIRNLVDYMVDDTGLFLLKHKSNQLFLFNQQKFMNERIPFLLFNLLLPVVFVLFMYSSCVFLRKKRLMFNSYSLSQKRN